MGSTVIAAGQEYLGTDAAARYMGRPAGTLRYWRAIRKGPRYAQIGKNVTYRRADLDEFIEGHLIEPEAS